MPAKAPPRDDAAMALVLDRAMAGILHRSMDRKLLFVNDYFCHLVGRRADALHDIRLEEFLHPDDAQLFRDMFARHAERAEPFMLDLRYTRPDGTSLWCSAHVSFVVDGEGAVTSYILAAQDISARHQTEQQLRETGEHYRHSIAVNPLINWTAHPDGSIDEVSLQWEEITGVTPEAARGEGWRVFVHPDDIDRTGAQWHWALVTGASIDLLYRLRSRLDGYRWVRARASVRRDGEGRILRWYGTLEDVHERVQAEARNAYQEERFRLAVHAAQIGIWDYDPIHQQREWSPELRDILGLPPATAADVEQVLAIIHPQDQGVFRALLDPGPCAQPRRKFDEHLRIHRGDTGAERWLRIVGWKSYLPSGRFSRAFATVRDITDERTADDRIRWSTSHDALTHLPTRSLFQAQLEAAISEGETTGSRVGLLLVDVDHLKEINDTLGHAAGDAVLQIVAERLRLTMSASSTVARLGGDEFAVILKDGMNGAAIEQAARSVIARLREPIQIEGKSIDCRASVGASLYPDHAGSPDELLKAADLALYSVKGAGRGHVQIFAPAMREKLHRRSAMLGCARTAVEQARIFPYYQPVVRLEDRRIVGFEALLRWRDEADHLRLPRDIAPAFENFDLATEISRQMMAAVFDDLQGWLAAGLPVGRVALNMSAMDFRTGDFAQRVLAELKKRQVPSHHIEIEVTETAFFGHGADDVDRALHALSAAGVRVALDDFGTGYSSLSHLQRFPVNTLKIDRSFVRHVEDGSDAQVIIDAVLNLARGLKLDVVAEGVERPEQVGKLLERGCRYGQGFYFSRPVPAARIAGLLSDLD